MFRLRRRLTPQGVGFLDGLTDVSLGLLYRISLFEVQLSHRKDRLIESVRTPAALGLDLLHPFKHGGGFSRQRALYFEHILGDELQPIGPGRSRIVLRDFTIELALFQA